MHRKSITYFITGFFTDYLENEIGLSNNTVKSYRDAFVLYFKYLDEKGNCKLNKLKMDVMNMDNINGFLTWLEESRGNSIHSRNQRLAALKAFCNYVIRKSPEESNTCQNVLNIRVKKAPQKTIEYLTVDAIESLLKIPDKNTLQGIRDLAIISFLYETGCRVQELIDLKVGDISFRTPNTVILTGKGNKSRVIPISKNIGKILKVYLNSAKIYDAEQHVFVNRNDEPLSRSGIAYILNKYAQISREESRIF